MRYKLLESGRQRLLESLATEIDHAEKAQFLPRIVERRNSPERLLRKLLSLKAGHLLRMYIACVRCNHASSPRTKATHDKVLIEQIEIEKYYHCP